MKKKNKGICKNGHPIGKDALCVFRHMAGSCNNCRYPFVHSAFMVIYAGERVNNLKERFHHYHFAHPYPCPKCGAWLTGITISCKRDNESDWTKALMEELDENLHSTPDNGSDV